MPASFLWYDLETWGTDPRHTRIAQFAAQRTDSELQPLGPPELVWVAPALDFVPAPDAALVTGLDPFEVERRGCNEAEAFRRIAACMGAAGTCGVGWNSLRFDDEFIRYGLYRNFHDPYAREWSNGNSRWDLLDFARLCHALRPEGVIWPQREDGAPSFRLEHLAAANGIEHSAAHDALSDVGATIGMARVFRAAQPRLWDYHLGFRDKRRVAELLDPARPRALLHVSSRFPASRACAGIVWPLCRHPLAGNQIIVVELHDEVEPLLTLDGERIAARVFTAAADLPEGVARISLKAVHLNRCPALVDLAHVRPAELERMGLDRERCLAHARQLQAEARLAEKVSAIYATRRFDDGPTDVDAALYQQLPERADERVRQSLRSAAPEQLASFCGQFRDRRGDEMLWRYRARNWPHSLDAEERSDWAHQVAQRILGDHPGEPLSLGAARARLDELRTTATSLSLLDQLDAWYRRIERECGGAESG